MIIGLPRSGTTWAANLFSTDAVLCHHDPLYHTHYSEWDEKLTPDAACPVGVSCTGIWRWAEWLNKHQARKVILHRDGAAIADSMRQIGLPGIDLLDAQNKLMSVIGLHVPHTDLFDPEKCCKLWNYLIGDSVPFNWVRHALLTDIEMQPKFSGLTVGKHVTRRLMIELASAGDGE
jgi:hypothetical protein